MPKTLFIDLDGTLVKHNYQPLDQRDEILPGTLGFLRDAQEQGHFLILTTHRTKTECHKILQILKEAYGLEFNRYLFELPVGVRVLINDTKDQEVRAVAIPVERNKGLLNITV